MNDSVRSSKWLPCSPGRALGHHDCRSRCSQVCRPSDLSLLARLACRCVAADVHSTRHMREFVTACSVFEIAVGLFCFT